MISNPLSGKNRRGALTAVGRLLQDYGTIPHREVRTVRDARDALDAFAADGVDLVVVNSGDGTVQAVLTLLFTESRFSSMPLLALLSGGTTNMTHQELGLPGPGIEGLRRLLNWLDHGEGDAFIRRRALLKVQTASCRQPLYGLFFGAAGIFKGIQFFHSRMKRMGLRGDPAHLLILGRFLWALARRKDELVAPERIAIHADAYGPLEVDALMLLVTTLDRLILGLKPFWGSGSGPLRLTAVGVRPRRLMCALPSLVRGRNSFWATPANGYLSRRGHEIRLDLRGGFALDGELFATDPSSPLIRIQDGGAAAFLRV